MIKAWLVLGTFAVLLLPSCSDVSGPRQDGTRVSPTDSVIGRVQAGAVRTCSFPSGGGSPERTAS